MESAFSGKKFTANQLLPHALRIVARELQLAQNAAAWSCSPSLDLLKLALFACFCPALPCAEMPISFHPPLSILCLSTKISCADWYLQNALCQARSAGASVKAPLPPAWHSSDFLYRTLGTLTFATFSSFSCLISLRMNGVLDWWTLDGVLALAPPQPPAAAVVDGPSCCVMRAH